MKRKTIIILITVVLIILIGSAVISLKTKNEINKREEEYEEINNGSKELAINNQKDKSIEVTNIEISYMADNLSVTTTLKNNSTEAIHGFFIEINLLNKNKEIVTTVAENSAEVMEANSEFVLLSNVVGLDNAYSITEAKVVSIEENSAMDIENKFEEMQKEINLVE